ncbi:ultraviolet-B receptor UVR8-like [Musa acuminata AAA Group]|uniref:ultraviolet-B receptor UVR8-like n=1 Tax=Musa acuminata AAA Group TaxID=214697 RepID=UPI0031DC38C5
MWKVSRLSTLFPLRGGAWRAASVWSFGDNSNGALGLSAPLADAYEPTRVPSIPSDVAAVAAGHYHSLAVTASGEVWAWGRNEEGQIGRHATAPRATWNKPEKVIGLDHVRVEAAFASGVTSAAIDDDGSLWVWGRSKRGQLGLGNRVTEATKPTKVQALADHQIVKVSFGWGHALALTKDGKLFGWGYAADGRLGQMEQKLDSPQTQPLEFDKSLESLTPMLDVVEKLVAEKIEKEKNMTIIWEPCEVLEVSCLNVSDMACGLDHSLVLCSSGTVLSSGDNLYGQLGRNTYGSMLPVGLNAHALSVSAGLGHSLVLCQIPSEDREEVNAVLSWGWNQSHQLGREGREDMPGIVEALSGEKPTSLSAGRVHSIALTSKKELWAWGSGRNGRLGLGSSMDEMEPALVESLVGLEVLQAVAGFDHNLLLVVD